MAINDQTTQTLFENARLALEKAYSPYSNYKVGAALLGSSGRIYLGANIGNACSTLNCCAEQVAISAAVMSGETAFLAIAVVDSTQRLCSPCGRCLQLLSEFATDMEVLMSSSSDIKKLPLSYLLPVPYRRN